MKGSFDLRFYGSILLRRLPLVIPIIALAVGVGTMLAIWMPPVYRAAATLLVEPPQISSTLAPSTVPPNAIEQLQIIEQQIMTAANLLTLADRFGIYETRMDLTPADIVEDMRSRAKVEPVIFDTPSGGDGAVAFSVSFEAREASLAASVANELVDRILNRSQQLRTAKASETLKFFQGEVKRLNDELSQQERRILSFKNDNKDALPDSLDFHRRQQINLQERLLQIGREEAALHNRRASLQNFAGGPGTSQSLLPPTPEEQLLTEYQRTLVEQRAIFAESSPAITAIRSRITDLEDEVRKQRRGTEGSNQGQRPPSALDLQFADIDSQLAFFQQERAAAQKSLEKLAQLISATPGNETVLNALERTNQNTQAEYTLAVSRLASANTGEQIEAQSKGERLTLVERALEPQDPVRPNQIKIVLASLIVGLGLSGGLVVLLELMNKSVRRPIDLARELGIETFATIPHIRTRGEVAARVLAISLCGLIVLAAAPAAVYAVDAYHEPIGSVSNRLLFKLGWD